jgi:hypothetical protein
MPQVAPHIEHLPTVLPAIRQVSLFACMNWLRLGLNDLRAAWTVSLAHGVLFAGMGWLLISHGWNDPKNRS